MYKFINNKLKIKSTVISNQEINTYTNCLYYVA